MEKYIFDDLLSDTDRAVIKKGGYGKRRGFGQRPLLLIMNLQPVFLGADKPVTERRGNSQPLADYALSRVSNILALRDSARKNGVPVIYTRKVSDCDRNLALLGQRQTVNPQLLSNHPASSLLSRIEPLPCELVMEMSGESAFFGTPLESYLTKLKTDTLIIAGTSTSGSCRATAVDGITRTLNLGMVEDCLIERISALHKNALLDVWMKFGDVLDSGEAMNYFNSLKSTKEE